ncbi:MAG: Transcriptional regulator [Clostridium sp.]|jgi:uncharacterized protein YaaQ
MKLVMAIVHKDDSALVSSTLTKKGFSVTKLATTGGFLKSGNTTFIVGTEDEKVDQVISIISEQCRSRSQLIPNTSNIDIGVSSAFPVEVSVGGATIFVLNVDRFEKV